MRPDPSSLLYFSVSRWDIQRIREQRMFHRLQQRMNKKKIIQETEPELSSFYPDTEDGACALWCLIAE